MPCPTVPSLHNRAQITTYNTQRFRVISAHNKISPCQFRPIAILAHKFCQHRYQLRKIDYTCILLRTRIYKIDRVIMRKKSENILTLQTIKD